MIAHVLRVIAGVVVARLVQEVIRLLTAPVRREGTLRSSPRPTPRPPRIHIDRDNIVEGNFEDIPNREQR